MFSVCEGKIQSTTISNQCKIVNMNIFLPNSIDIKWPNGFYHMLMWYMKNDKTT